ncbi:MAG: DUF2807 domain-containing protein [Bacteroidaceae bacterium]|nr:DUF2807 domain-containing protein [Bacteroidaceae bacterium]
MKRKTFIALLISLVSFVPQVMADDDDYRSDYVTIPVEGLAAFENIISNASFDVDFRQSDKQSVEVYGDPNQVSNVNITVVGKTLYVGVKENARVSHVRVNITAPDLACVIVNGSGDVDVKSLHTTRFTATVTGTGDIELTGDCDEAEYTINGRGDIDAEDFRVENLTATVNDSGSVECRCTDTLTANVVGSGSVEFHGQPRNVYRSGRKAAIRHD